MPRRKTSGASSELIARAREAAEQIRAGGRATPELLAPIVAAVPLETARNRFPAAAMLAEFTVEHEEARAAVAELAADLRPHIRRRAIRCLSRDTPLEFRRRLIQASLEDSDRNVRVLAMSLIAYLKVTDAGRPAK